MRNYNALWLAMVSFLGTPQAWTFCLTSDDAAVAVEGFRNDPAYAGPDYSFTGPVQAYFKFNKANLVQIINAAHALWFTGPDFFAETELVVFGDDSPRDTWNSNAVGFHSLGSESASGYVSKPQKAAGAGKGGDFSGAKGLFDAANALLGYSDALRKAGEVREAGIVKFAYDQIFKQVWSITEAFDYLRKNHLA